MNVLLSLEVFEPLRFFHYIALTPALTLVLVFMASSFTHLNNATGGPNLSHAVAIPGELANS
jgi:hypothetical protein